MIHLTIQSECGSHDLAVDCTIKACGYPENTGYEINIDNIFMERGVRQRKLPKKLLDELSASDDFKEKVLESAKEN